MLNTYREQLMKLYPNIDTKIEDCLSNNSTRTSNFANIVDDDGMICNDDDDGICMAREPSPTSIITTINQFINTTVTITTVQCNRYAVTKKHMT
mmetsp:Transcript_36725/g.37147  ORF Transcript_36725/g.37147 Transcript_36725/m.37147 type:complete len:94 (-) Transcript_36725:59-340(-)